MAKLLGICKSEFIRDDCFYSSPYECKPLKNMFTPKNAKVVTSKPINAHQANIGPRKPLTMRKCSQAA